MFEKPDKTCESCIYQEPTKTGLVATGVVMCIKKKQLIHKGFRTCKEFAEVSNEKA